MRTARIGAILGVALVAVALAGCNGGGATLSNNEISQIKNKPSGGIPPEGQKAIADGAAEGQRKYLEHLKQTGQSPNNAPMPPAGATPALPPGAGAK
jgi:hypothetical protein